MAFGRQGVRSTVSSSGIQKRQRHGVAEASIVGLEEANELGDGCRRAPPQTLRIHNFATLPLVEGRHHKVFLGHVVSHDAVAPMKLRQVGLQILEATDKGDRWSIRGELLQVPELRHDVRP